MTCKAQVLTRHRVWMDFGRRMKSMLWGLCFDGNQHCRGEAEAEKEEDSNAMNDTFLQQSTKNRPTNDGSCSSLSVTVFPIACCLFVLREQAMRLVPVQSIPFFTTTCFHSQEIHHHSPSQDTYGTCRSKRQAS
ncbi:hypothetical protein K440DRAFT_132340 [Wilcoxina mikolae CBS 423.85]|nr:hypothetical protein K440DRAFT_132340 [Wilcoxina mikolae CBS 423.85]